MTLWQNSSPDPTIQNVASPFDLTITYLSIGLFPNRWNKKNHSFRHRILKYGITVKTGNAQTGKYPKI